MNLGRYEEGMTDLLAAQKQKSTAEHDVIDDAVRDGGQDYTVFSIPVGIIFRPNPNKIKNLQRKDYLGKARLISKDGTGYETFDGVDRTELAFRPEAPRRQATTNQERERLDSKPTPPAPAPETRSNLGRSSSDIGGTSAPRNPAGLSRAATAVAAPSRPAPTPAPEDRRPVQPLTRAATSVRPAQRPQSPPKPRSPEPLAPAPVRGLSVRRPPGVLKPAPPAPIDTEAEIYDSYAPVARSGEWAGEDRPGASPTRGLSRSASAMTGRSQGSYPSRSPSQFGVRRAPSRKGTMLSRRRRSYEEEEGYVSGDYDEVPFEATKLRVKVCTLRLFLHVRD